MMRKENTSETNHLTPNSPLDPFFSHATDLSTYMVNQDVDMIQYTLECNQALKEGRPRPPKRTRRDLVHEELKIQNPTRAGLQGDFKKALSNEMNDNKKKIVAQFSANSKSAGPVTENHHLRTVYKLEFEDGDGHGYYSDCTTNV